MKCRYALHTSPISLPRATARAYCFVTVLLVATLAVGVSGCSYKPISESASRPLAQQARQSSQPTEGTAHVPPGAATNLPTPPSLKRQASIPENSQATPVFCPSLVLPAHFQRSWSRFRDTFQTIVTVNIDGRASVELRKGTGNREADKLLLNQFRRWRWRPAMRSGRSVEFSQVFYFHLDKANRTIEPLREPEPAPVGLPHYFRSSPRLQFAFTVIDGHLEFGVPPGMVLGLPIEACLNLYRWTEKEGRGEQAFLIRSLSDLTGQVSITSPRAALSFVRLFTGPNTHFAVGAPQVAPPALVPASHYEGSKMEIIRQDQLTLDYFNGDKKDLEIYVNPKEDCDGYHGIVHPAIAKRFGLSLAHCVAEGAGFRVKRVLAVEYNVRKSGHYSDDRYGLFLVEEWVGSGGTYRLERVTPLTPQTAGRLHLMFPEYM